MAVGLSAPEVLYPVNGVRLASCHSGIKADVTKTDLVLMELDEQSEVAAVFTTNKFCAAPVTLAKEHLNLSTSIRYLLINSGNANAGTGEKGMQATKKCCEAVANHSGCDVSGVLPFSTGVIGQQLPDKKISQAIPHLVESLDEVNWLDAATGIMTTDTLPKAVSRQIDINGQRVSITGICKGSGMIKPDMATMLAYVATDAQIEQETLQNYLTRAVDLSFNSITVDGDTSTNDACVLIATCQSSAKVGANNADFEKALNEVFKDLAHAIIRDGEGATKFVEIQVEQAINSVDARQMAYTIAHSPLVKTALFASDANWGRILAAVGRAPVSTLEIEKVDLYLGDVCLIKNGLPDENYNEEKGQAEMEKQDIVIRVNLNLGEASSTVWTSDLSFDYVKINAEYRS